MNLFNLLFPKRCINCGRFGQLICGKCAGKIETVNTICPMCEKPSFLGATHKKCQTRFSLDGVTSCFYYDGIIKKAIHRFKYRPFLTDLAKELTILMVNNLKNDRGLMLFLKHNPTVVPIPLHWWRRHIRGYNQTELISRLLGNHFKLKHKNLLIRRKYTKPQSEISFKKRKTNVEDIFEVDKRLLTEIPKSLILLDDIWTTGSTLKSACKELKKNGVEKIWGLTLAR